MPSSKKSGSRIDQPGNAFARGQAALLVLRLDALRAAALAQLGLFIFKRCEAINHLPGVLARSGGSISRARFALGINGGTSGSGQ